MFNLLPENLKKKITREYKLRLTIIILAFVISTQVFLLVFLFPSWLLSFYRGKDFLVRSDEINRFLSAEDVSSTISYIKVLNSKLKIIDENQNYPELIPVLNSVLKERTSNIRINGISYTVNSANSGVLTLSGIGGSRESLVSFSKKIKEIEFFKKVDLPLSNLAKDKDIEFSININIEK